MTTTQSSIIQELIPIGSTWRRTRGNHAGRIVQVTSTTSRSVHVLLIGKRYDKQKNKGAGQNNASIPFDEFTSLYTPEQSTVIPPNRYDLHRWHKEINTACNCPPYIRQMYPENSPLTLQRAIDVVTNKRPPHHVPIELVATDPVLRAELPEDTTILKLSPTEQQSFITQFRTIFDNRETGGYHKLLQRYHINSNDAAEILRFHNATPSEEEYRLYKQDINRERWQRKAQERKLPVLSTTTSTPTPTHSTSNSKAPLDHLIKPEQQREFVTLYKSNWESNTKPAPNWFLVLCSAYGVNGATAKKILEANDAVLSQEYKDERRLFWERAETKAKGLRGPRGPYKPRQPSTNTNLQDTVVDPDTVPTLEIIPSIPSLTNSWTIHVIRETTVIIQANTLLDALALADADPLNTEVIGVMKVRKK